MSVSVAPDSYIPPSSSSGGNVSWRSSVSFNIRVNEQDQQVAFAGMLRPFVSDHMKAIRATLETAASNATGELCLDFKRLKYMNSIAFLEINRFLRWVVDARPNLRIKLIISSVIPWAIRKFQVIAEIYPKVTVEIYDKAFYPIQSMLEDADFIGVLRLQERIVWQHEQKVLPGHGLRAGMRVADIACGLGDFVVALQRQFRPEYIVGVDHSKASLKHAQAAVREMALENVEFQYGDAAAMLLPDNSFDFVTCRLSLQVFHQPDLIMHELFRICKPGGRIYITNELISCIFGYPEPDAIRSAYAQYLQLGRMLGVDLDMGMRTRQLLTDAGLEDIKVTLIDINNMNTDRHDFATVVERWINVVGQMAETTNVSKEVYEEICAGMKLHAEAIANPRGLASWPIYAGSGRKPLFV